MQQHVPQEAKVVRGLHPLHFEIVHVSRWKHYGRRMYQETEGAATTGKIFHISVEKDENETCKRGDRPCWCSCISLFLFLSVHAHLTEAGLFNAMITAFMLESLAYQSTRNDEPRRKTPRYYHRTIRPHSPDSVSFGSAKSRAPEAATRSFYWDENATQAGRWPRFDHLPCSRIPSDFDNRFTCRLDEYGLIRNGSRCNSFWRACPIAMKTIA